MNRTANAIFGLVYPAVLGTLLFGLFQNPQSAVSSSPVAILLLGYFVLQYVQGSRVAALAPKIEERGYALGDLLADLGEIASMLAAFVVLDYFPQNAAINGWLPTFLTENDLGKGIVLACVFALPPVTRLIDMFGRRQRWWDPPCRPASAMAESDSWVMLTVMSIIAALGGLFHPFTPSLALCLICISILAYWWVYLREAP